MDKLYYQTEKKNLASHSNAQGSMLFDEQPTRVGWMQDDDDDCTSNVNHSVSRLKDDQEPERNIIDEIENLDNIDRLIPPPKDPMTMYSDLDSSSRNNSTSNSNTTTEWSDPNTGINENQQSNNENYPSGNLSNTEENHASDEGNQLHQSNSNDCNLPTNNQEEVSNDQGQQLQSTGEPNPSHSETTNQSNSNNEQQDPLTENSNHSVEQLPKDSNNEPVATDNSTPKGEQSATESTHHSVEQLTTHNTSQPDKPILGDNINAPVEQIATENVNECDDNVPKHSHQSSVTKLPLENALCGIKRRINECSPDENDGVNKVQVLETPRGHSLNVSVNNENDQTSSV